MASGRSQSRRIAWEGMCSHPSTVWPKMAPSARKTAMYTDEPTT